MYPSNTPTARALPPGRRGAGGRAGRAGQTLAAFFGSSALPLLADFAFLAGPADAFVAVETGAFVAVAVVPGALGAALAVGFDPAVRDEAVLDPAVRDEAGFAAVPADLVRVAAGVAGVADSPLAASFSEATAVSRALVAVLI